MGTISAGGSTLAGRRGSSVTELQDAIRAREGFRVEFAPLAAVPAYQERIAGNKRALLGLPMRYVARVTHNFKSGP
jgi:hypothetical protein